MHANGLLLSVQLLSAYFQRAVLHASLRLAKVPSQLRDLKAIIYVVYIHISVREIQMSSRSLADVNSFFLHASS